MDENSGELLPLLIEQVESQPLKVFQEDSTDHGRPYRKNLKDFHQAKDVDEQYMVYTKSCLLWSIILTKIKLFDYSLFFCIYKLTKE